MIVAARNMKRALEIKLTTHGITASQFAVLKVLWQHNSLSLTVLGKAVHFDNSTLTGMVERMVRAKLVRRIRDRNDRRIIKISLTEKGRGLQDTLSRLADEVDLEAVKNFTEEEKITIKILARRVRENMVENNSQQVLKT